MTTAEHPPPDDPVVRELARLLHQRGRRRVAPPAMNRRTLLGLGATTAATAALAPLLSACAPPAPPTASGTATLNLPQDLSATQKTARFSSWTQYLDESDDGKHYPTLEAFEKATGIKVTYSEDIDDNNSYYNKIAPQLQAGTYDSDLFIFTDWMAHRLIENQFVQPLDLIEMPHASNLLESMKQAPYDPGRHYSLPWQAGFTGIGWNKAKLGRDLKSVDDLWAPDLKGKVVVVSEMRDTVALFMQQQGHSVVDPFTEAQISQAMDVVRQKLADGWIRRVQGNSYVEDLKSGNALAGIVWSGDIFTLQDADPKGDWQFAIPESGGTLWSDAALIPITSHHRANAMKLLDWYYQPRIAAQVSAYVNYVCPVAGAQAEMEKIDPELAKSWLVFPTDEFIRQHHIEIFRALTPDEDARYGAMWAKVMGE